MNLARMVRVALAFPCAVAQDTANARYRWQDKIYSAVLTVDL